jgi:hypothetical protein
LGLFFLSHQKEPKNGPQAGGLTIAYTTQGGACDSYKIHGWDYFDSLASQRTVHQSTILHRVSAIEKVCLSDV